MREAKINLPHQVGVNVYWQLWEGDKLRQGSAKVLLQTDSKLDNFSQIEHSSLGFHNFYHVNIDYLVNLSNIVKL